MKLTDLKKPLGSQPKATKKKVIDADEHQQASADAPKPYSWPGENADGYETFILKQ